VYRILPRLMSAALALAVFATMAGDAFAGGKFP
jgi:hypothetical protein